MDGDLMVQKVPELSPSDIPISLRVELHETVSSRKATYRYWVAIDGRYVFDGELMTIHGTPTSHTAMIALAYRLIAWGEGAADEGDFTAEQLAFCEANVKRIRTWVHSL